MALPKWLRVARGVAGALALIAAGVFLVGWWRGVPEGDNPFVNLRLDEPLGLYSKYKIIDLANAPDACQDVLAGSTLEYAPIADRKTGEFCAFDNAVAINKSHVPYSGPVRVTCPMAAALYLWERDVLQPLAREHLDAEVRLVQHVGTYACRRVYGGRSGQPSEHATANAIDIIGFTLDDGREISVLKHWDADNERAAFLNALHARSCKVFRGVLGPEYNTQHADHFHLDLGRYDLCR